MSDEPTISPFKSTPLDRHGDDREAASIEADRMFARFVSIPQEAFRNCAAHWRKRQKYAAGIELLQRKVAELDVEIEAVVAPERPRAYQYLRQAVVWFVQYVRGQRKKPPTTWKFTEGEVRITKTTKGKKTEWADDNAILAALRESEVPFDVLSDCIRMSEVPNKEFIEKHLVKSEDGGDYFEWADEKTGEVTRVGVTVPVPGGDTALRPFRRVTPPPIPYKLEVVVNEQAEEVEAPWLALDPHTEDEGGETDGE